MHNMSCIMTLPLPPPSSHTHTHTHTHRHTHTHTQGLEDRGCYTLTTLAQVSPLFRVAGSISHPCTCKGCLTTRLLAQLNGLVVGNWNGTTRMHSNPNPMSSLACHTPQSQRKKGLVTMYTTSCTGNQIWLHPSNSKF